MEVENDITETENSTVSENLPAKIEQSKMLPTVPTGTNIY